MDGQALSFASPSTPLIVLAGLVPAIHGFLADLRYALPGRTNPFLSFSTSRRQKQPSR
jgi:hypothetical protein